MALKGKDKIQLEALETSIKGMIAAGADLALLETGFRPQIQQIEESAGVIIKFSGEGKEFALSVVDTSKDFLRVRDSNQENKVLRAKVAGVSIEIKTFKFSEFLHSNQEIAESLSILAKYIAEQPEQLSSLEAGDLKPAFDYQKTLIKEEETNLLNNFADADADALTTNKPEVDSYHDE